MNTQQLEYLREAVRAGSFSRAADTLGLNQSVLRDRKSTRLNSSH